jgi:hypothetical protein
MHAPGDDRFFAELRGCTADSPGSPAVTWNGRCRPARDGRSGSWPPT